MVDLRLEELRTAQLEPVSLLVGGGRCTAVHGASGAGKTLLLRAIADLDPSTGEVWLGEVRRSLTPAPDWRRRVLLVPAESHWWAETVRSHAATWDMELLDELGFGADVLDWEVARLSSGERQRLGLARALSRRPLALLLDEPTANLDAGNTARVEAVIRRYRQRHAAPVLWVSHDPGQRQRVADAAALIERGRVTPEAACS